jgi:hypothetical protein
MRRASSDIISEGAAANSPVVTSPELFSPCAMCGQAMTEWKTSPLLRPVPGGEELARVRRFRLGPPLRAGERLRMHGIGGQARLVATLRRLRW